jgi:hypothetical protein
MFEQIDLGPDEGKGVDDGALNTKGNMRTRTSRWRPGLGLLALACTAAFTFAGAGTALAAGGTTSSDGTTVTYNDAGTTDRNDIDVSADSSFVYISDYYNANTAGPGCTQDGTNAVQCPIAGISKVVVNLSNGNPQGSENYAFVESNVPSSISATLNGGSGRDQLDTSSHPADAGNALNGGAGDDQLYGAQGDTLNGGDGNDELSITDRGVSTPSTLSGGSGQDQMNSSVHGNDTLNADNGNSSMYSYAAPGVTVTENGGSGNNFFSGSGINYDNLNLAGCGVDKCGTTLMNGGSGNDRFSPGTGADNMIGGGGENEADFSNFPAGVNISLDTQANDGLPGQGANVHSDVQDLVGSSYADKITGTAGPSEYIQGNGGNDSINVFNTPAKADFVSCGTGFATINADVLDVISSSGPTGCYGKIVRPAKKGPGLKVGPGRIHLSHGKAPVSVHCSGAGACRGLLSMVQGRTVIASAPIVVPNKKTRIYDLSLPAKVLSRLHKGHNIRVTITADATDNVDPGVTDKSRKVTLVGSHHKK